MAERFSRARDEPADSRSHRHPLRRPGMLQAKLANAIAARPVIPRHRANTTRLEFVRWRASRQSGCCGSSAHGIARAVICQREMRIDGSALGSARVGDRRRTGDLLLGRTVLLGHRLGNGEHLQPYWGGFSLGMRTRTRPSGISDFFGGAETS